MKKLLLVLFFTLPLYAEITPAKQSFNAGEVSPLLKGRSDFGKYDNACETLENMLLTPQGPLLRRPGTKYVAEVKDSNHVVRLISFEYSKTDAYMIEAGDNYFRFYRDVNGEAGQILIGGSDANPYELTTVFNINDLPNIQWAQNENVMYIVDGNHPPQKLVRNDHNDWDINDANIITGPFMDENRTATTVWLDSTATTDVNLIASANIFNSGHVGSLWKLGHRKAETTLHGKLDANESSDTISCSSEYTYNIQGTWIGTVTLERSFDSNTTWEAVYTRYNNGSALNVDYTETETEEDVIYRVTMTGFGTGSATYNFSVYDYYHYGIVKVLSYIDENEVNVGIIEEVNDTNKTTKWSEGYWSGYRGWPQTLEFHEQRLIFGGSSSFPQTIWTSRTAMGKDNDYEDFTSGILDTDAVIYILPGQNPIQWLMSQDYLLVGTLSGAGRWGSSTEPITPANPTNYRIQARNGATYLRPALVGDALLYIERGGRRVREFTYSFERDRFVAPDMTILAEHITESGIKEIACQTRPDTKLLCVRNDGEMAVLTYERNEEVVGWSRYITDGEYESVTVIPGSDEDEIWVEVKREIDGNDIRYIEQFQPQDWGDDQTDCFFVDSGLSFDGGAAVGVTGITKASPAVVTVSSWPKDGDDTNLADGDQIKFVNVGGMTQLNNNIYTIDDANINDSNFTLNDSTNTTDINSTSFGTYTSGGTVQRFEKTFTNLGHLEGKTVSVLADGETLSNETVSSDSITIDKWANKVHIGLPFTSKIKTMPFVFGTQSGTTAGRKAKISSVKADFYEALGAKCGIDENHNKNVPFYDAGQYTNEMTPVYTGWLLIEFLYGYYREPAVYFEQSQPLPFGVRNIVPVMDVTE